MVPTVTLKRCSKCGGDKPRTEFFRNSAARDGLQSQCKACQSGTPAQRERMRQRKRRPDYTAKAQAWRRTSRLRRYGLTEEEFVAMLDAQGNACAACRRDFSDDLGPCIDHDHDTGEVRGLLCSGCNTALGMLADDPVRISGLLIYLQGRVP